MAEPKFEDLPEVQAAPAFEDLPEEQSNVNVLDKLGRSIKSGVSGIAQGLSLGTADELTAGLSVPGGMLENLLSGKQVPSIGEQYKLNLDAERARDEALKAENPIEFGGGEAVGAVAPALVTGGLGLARTGISAVAQPAKFVMSELMKRIGKGAAQGATAGIGYGNVGDAAQGIDAALIPAALGAAIPGAGGLLQGIKSLGKKAAPMVANVLTGVPEEAIKQKIARPEEVRKAALVSEQDLADKLGGFIDRMKTVETSNFPAYQALTEAKKRLPASNIVGGINKVLDEVKNNKVFATGQAGGHTIKELETIKQQIKQIADKGGLKLEEVFALTRQMRDGVSYDQALHGVEKKVNEYLKKASNNVYDTLKQYSETHVPEFAPIMKDLSSKMQALGNLAQGATKPDALLSAAKRTVMTPLKAKTTDAPLKELEQYGISPLLQEVKDKAASDAFLREGPLTGWQSGAGLGVGALAGLGSMTADVVSGKDVDPTRAIALAGTGFGGTMLSRKYGGRVAEGLIEGMAKKSATKPAIISTAAQRAAIQQIAKQGEKQNEKQPMSEIPSE